MKHMCSGMVAPEAEMPMTRADFDLNNIKRSIAHDSELRLAEAEEQARKNKTIDKAKDFAFSVWAQFQELKEVGFTDDQAMKIVELIIENNR